MTSIKFPRYYGGSVDIDISVLESAMHSESLDKNQYDYRDGSGLSFQKISKTRILIADPAFPITKQILNDRWQIFYDPTFTGYQNIRFVPRDTVASNANSKDINDVLETYFYQGILPIPSFINIYMMIVPISEAGTNNYIIGTLFTPSQPYLKISYMYNASVNNIIPADLVFARVQYDQVVETLGAEETDKNISLITSGNDVGTVLLPVPGRYSLHATFTLNEATTSPFNTSVYRIGFKINGVIKEVVACAVNYLIAAGGETIIPGINSGTVGSAKLSSTFLIKESDLTATGPNTTAKLEIIGAHNCRNQRAVQFGAQNSDPNDNWNPYTMATINFLG